MVFGTVDRGSSPLEGIKEAYMKNQTLKFNSWQLLSLAVLGLFLLWPMKPVFAQIPVTCQGPIVTCGGSGQPACTLPDIFTLINNIINFFLLCLAPLFGVLLLIIGGAYFLIAGPSPERLNTAKRIIIAVVISLIIIYTARSFLNAFLNAIGGGAWRVLGH